MVARFDAGGRLDPSFSGDGRTYVDVAGVGFGTAIAVQPDGRILVGGIEGSNSPVLIRLLRDGRLDPSFGTGGIERRLGLKVSRIAVRDDGAILLAGDDLALTAPNVPATVPPRVERHLADGSPDTGFGNGGTVLLPTTGLDRTTDVVPLNGGFTLVSWSRQAGDFAVARLLPNGSLDNTFGTGGIASTTFPEGAGSARDLIVQADNSIVAAGSIAPTATPANDVELAVARFTSGGTPDGGFGTGGRTLLPATATTAADRERGHRHPAGRAPRRSPWARPARPRPRRRPCSSSPPTARRTRCSGRAGSASPPPPGPTSRSTWPA